MIKKIVLPIIVLLVMAGTAFALSYKYTYESTVDPVEFKEWFVQKNFEIGSGYHISVLNPDQDSGIKKAGLLTRWKSDGSLFILAYRYWEDGEPKRYCLDPKTYNYAEIPTSEQYCMECHRR